MVQSLITHHDIPNQLPATTAERERGSETSLYSQKGDSRRPSLEEFLLEMMMGIDESEQIE